MKNYIIRITFTSGGTSHATFQHGDVSAVAAKELSKLRHIASIDWYFGSMVAGLLKDARHICTFVNGELDERQLRQRCILGTHLMACRECGEEWQRGLPEKHNPPCSHAGI